MQDMGVNCIWANQKVWEDRGLLMNHSPRHRQPLKGPLKQQNIATNATLLHKPVLQLRGSCNWTLEQSMRAIQAMVSTSAAFWIRWGYEMLRVLAGCLSCLPLMSGGA